MLMLQYSILVGLGLLFGFCLPIIFKFKISLPVKKQFEYNRIWSAGFLSASNFFNFIQISPHDKTVRKNVPASDMPSS